MTITTIVLRIYFARHIFNFCCRKQSSLLILIKQQNTFYFKNEIFKNLQRTRSNTENHLKTSKKWGGGEKHPKVKETVIKSILVLLKIFLVLKNKSTCLDSGFLSNCLKYLFLCYLYLPGNYKLT